MHTLARAPGDLVRFAEQSIHGDAPEWLRERDTLCKLSQSPQLLSWGLKKKSSDNLGFLQAVAVAMYSTTAAYRTQSGSGEREENFPVLKKPEQRIALKSCLSV